MAHIVLNGRASKTRLLISPQPPPQMVRAYRDLELMRGKLAHFQQEFLGTPETLKAVQKRVEEVGGLITEYCRILETCKRALGEDVASMPDEKKAYYNPVLIFLSRAADAHTIIPFDRYLQMYRNVLTKNSTTRQKLEPLSQFRGFIEERIAESIRTCEAYSVLLAESIGTHMAFFSMGEMLFKIATSQREVSTSYRRTGNVEELQAIRQQHRQGVRLDLGSTGELLGIAPLTYFVLLQIVSNAFKASFGAYWLQKRGQYIGEAYCAMPQLPEPQIDISLARVDVVHAKVVIADNGMGVPEGMLDRLMHAPDERGIDGFMQIQPSNSSSTILFPFLADLLGAEIVLLSEGVGRGFRTELRFPMDLNMGPAAA